MICGLAALSATRTSAKENWLRRWAEYGVWVAMLAILIESGFSDDRQHMIKSTTVRDTDSAAGVKRAD